MEILEITIKFKFHRVSRIHAANSFKMTHKRSIILHMSSANNGTVEVASLDGQSWLIFN